MKAFLNVFLCIVCLTLPGFGQKIDREVRDDVIRRISRLLQTHYVYPEKAVLAENFLKRKRMDSGYKHLDHPRAFAQEMTKDLQSVLEDRHVRVMVIDPVAHDPLFDLVFNHYDKYKRNYGVRAVRIYPSNIGYIQLDSFEALEVSRAKINAAMQFLSDVHALIIDVRRNSGGNPVTVQYLCSYFFDEPVHLNNQYWRRGDYIEEFWTFEQVDGPKLVDIPLFILTSTATFSAAEELAYSLQVQNRATVIGETTGGGANPGHSYQMGDLFSIFIPTGRPINPLTQTNWEGSGVKPDIIVAAANALNVALDNAELSARRVLEEKDAQALKEILDICDVLKQNSELSMLDTATVIAVLEPKLSRGIERGVLDEWSINALGYHFLNHRTIQLAIIIFKLNVKRFPQSANVYDSLGEAYLKNGETEQALKNYKKSLSIDPSNHHASQMIELILAR